jgi:hypothetical protein
MTRDQASEKLQKELGWTRTQADLHVSGSACLGMLKLDDPPPRPRQFVLAYQGLLHGPFETADEASRFAKRGAACGPWSIQQIHQAMTNEQMDAADAKHAAGAKPAIDALER